MLKTSQLEYSQEKSEGNSTNIQETDAILNKPATHQNSALLTQLLPTGQSLFAEIEVCWSPGPSLGAA